MDVIPLFVKEAVAAAPAPGPPKLIAGGKVYANPGFVSTT